jgi:hypothetical protein
MRYYKKKKANFDFVFCIIYSINKPPLEPSLVHLPKILSDSGMLVSCKPHAPAISSLTKVALRLEIALRSMGLPILERAILNSNRFLLSIFRTISAFSVSVGRSK